MKIIKIVILIISIPLAGFLSGCFVLPVEEDYIPPAFFNLPEAPPWHTVEVVRGDVELFSVVTARHQPAREEVLNFPAAGALITGVYVNVGDEVKAGDIIASLDRSSVAGDLERLTREEGRLLLRIEQLNERHEHTLWMADISGIPVDDSFYINQRRDLLEDLAMLRAELDYIQRQYESRLIRATMDGVVTMAMTFTERQWSTHNQRIATIADQTLSLFIVEMREAQTMEPGMRFEMDIAGNMVWAEVIDPAEHGIIRPEANWDEAILIVEGGGTFSHRALGRIHAVFAAAYDVLYIPGIAVHSANDQHFVYVLEDGIRRIRHVEIGLESAVFTEIVSGLSLGEWVVV